MATRCDVVLAAVDVDESSVDRLDSEVDNCGITVVALLVILFNGFNRSTYLSVVGGDWVVLVVVVVVVVVVVLS